MTAINVPEQDFNTVPLQPADIHICFYGPGAVHHTMPCAVDLNKPAVYNVNAQVLEPSWVAQASGWRLLKVRPGREWLFKIVDRFIFSQLGREL